MAYGSSLDCIGPMATSVKDAALILSVISGTKPAKPTPLGPLQAGLWLGAYHVLHRPLASVSANPFTSVGCDSSAEVVWVSCVVSCRPPFVMQMQNPVVLLVARFGLQEGPLNAELNLRVQ